jgi:hypothetical protein
MARVMSKGLAALCLTVVEEAEAGLGRKHDCVNQVTYKNSSVTDSDAPSIGR